MQNPNPILLLNCPHAFEKKFNMSFLSLDYIGTWTSENYTEFIVFIDDQCNSYTFDVLRGRWLRTINHNVEFLNKQLHLRKTFTEKYRRAFLPECRNTSYDIYIINKKCYHYNEVTDEWTEDIMPHPYVSNWKCNMYAIYSKQSSNWDVSKYEFKHYCVYNMHEIESGWWRVFIHNKNNIHGFS